MSDGQDPGWRCLTTDRYRADQHYRLACWPRRVCGPVVKCPPGEWQTLGSLPRCCWWCSSSSSFCSCSSCCSSSCCSSCSCSCFCSCSLLLLLFFFFFIFSFSFFLFFLLLFFFLFLFFVVVVVLLLLLRFPAISLCEIFTYVAVFFCFFFYQTVEVVTFRLCGWSMLRGFLLPAFPSRGHECQDLLTPCDGMHVCKD